MSADLPPDVRDRAARAAFEHSWRISPYPGWDDLPEEWREIQRAEVDAVAEVLANENTREHREHALSELINLVALLGHGFAADGSIVRMVVDRSRTLIEQGPAAVTCDDRIADRDAEFAREIRKWVKEEHALKARVAELEEKAEHWRQRWENRNEHVDLISCDRDALKVELESVFSENGDVIRENQRKLDEIVTLHGDKDALQARVDLLTTALQADLAVLQVLGRPDPEDPEFPAALAQERAESVRALFAASHIE